MATRYVGKGGSDSNGGTSWADRKLTLTGVEALAAANDTIYVGPGVYREQLTIPWDNSGSSGQPIVYIADILGENTDGVGGIVKISGHDSDTDQVPDRTYNIFFQQSAGQCADYRTFRGFTFQGFLNWSGSANIGWASGISTDIIIEDCVFMPNTNQSGSIGDYGSIRVDGRYTTDVIVRRCIFWGTVQGFDNTSGGSDINMAVDFENCLFYNCGTGISFTNVYGWSVIACTFLYCGTGVYAFSCPSTATNTVSDCLFVAGHVSINISSSVVSHDYNLFAGCITNPTLGSNEITTWYPVNPPLFASGIESASQSGIRMPWDMFRPSETFVHLRRADSGSMPSDDLYGLTRPSSGKRTPGAIQARIPRRDADRRRQGPSSLALDDAGRHIMTIPTEVGRTYRVNVHAIREANYSGTNPQVVIRRIGETDITLTDSGSADVWNRLTTPVTMSATGKFMQVHLISNNTATSGNYKVNFDSFDIKRIG